MNLSATDFEKFNFDGTRAPSTRIEKRVVCWCDSAKAFIPFYARINGIFCGFLGNSMGLLRMILAACGNVSLLVASY